MSARRPNAPYFQLDILGRIGLNVYRTAARGWRVEMARNTLGGRLVGVYVQTGPVGTFLRWRADA